MSSLPESEVIVPLYQYPLTEQTWAPLHDAISKHPNLNFIVIVNPNSGPGVDPAGWLPDRRYTREIRRLTARPNVRAVGYVRLDYCRRDFAEIKEDINKYANWADAALPPNPAANVSSDSDDDSAAEDLADKTERTTTTINGGTTGLGVCGIFFDETPNLYEETVAKYLYSAGQLVRSLPGILNPRLIIHNPGTVPDPEYATYWQQLPNQSPLTDSNNINSNSEALQDLRSATSENCTTKNSSYSNGGGGAPTITTVFEESHALWSATALQTRLKELLRSDRDQCCYMVHSVPPGLTTELTMELRQKGKYIFVTDLCERPYEKWGSSWAEFIDAMVMTDRVNLDEIKHVN